MKVPKGLHPNDQGGGKLSWHPDKPIEGNYERPYERVKKIDEARLKPPQKFVIFKKHALSRLIYVTDHCMAGHTELLNGDRMVRRAVIKWLHLELSMADGLLYVKRKDGGLG